jgi:hypothetical protein
VCCFRGRWKRKRDDKDDDFVDDDDKEEEEEEQKEEEETLPLTIFIGVVVCARIIIVVEVDFLMMMMMMRDVLGNRTFLFFSTDRRKPLSLSLEFFMCFLLPDSRRIFKKKTKKKNLICQNAKRNLEVPPHKNNLD